MVDIDEIKPVSILAYFLLNKPIYIGACILHLSKLIICDHHIYIKGRYDHKANLLFTNTGSLTYEIEKLR